MAQQNITSDSAERVAFELMQEIAVKETQEPTRQYYLTLYYQCWRAVRGGDPEDILERFAVGL